MAEIWLWIGGYAVALIALQILVYYYYIRQDRGGTIQPSTATGEQRSAQWATGQSTDQDGGGPAGLEGQRCRHCGTHNEASSVFRYCKECGEAMSR